MIEKEKDKIYSRMHDERNLGDSIIFIFVYSIILYFVLKLFKLIFYGNLF